MRRSFQATMDHTDIRGLVTALHRPSWVRRWAAIIGAGSAPGLSASRPRREYGREKIFRNLRLYTETSEVLLAIRG